MPKVGRNGQCLFLGGLTCSVMVWYPDGTVRKWQVDLGPSPRHTCAGKRFETTIEIGVVCDEVANSDGESFATI